MTRNQIAYWELQEKQREADQTHGETVRHNKETEAVSRSNLVLGQQTLAETHRSNVAKETETNRSNLAKEAENFRHNTETESLGWAQHQESVRHNEQNEAVAWMNAATNRYAAEEQGRHNTQMEAYNSTMAEIAQQQANTAEQQEKTARASMRVAARNADTNAANAKTAARRADIDAMNAETRKYEAKTNRIGMWFGAAEKASSTLNNALDSAQTLAPFVGQAIAKIMY